jgi:hypothetical protein
MKKLESIQSKIKATAKDGKEQIKISPISPSKKTIASKSFPKKLLIAILVCITLLGFISYFGYKHLVLAWVDNTPITRYSLYKQLEDKYGKDFTEQLISESLIQKEANAKGVEVSETEIDGEIKKIEDSQGGAEKLKQAMEAQNVTMTQIRNQIKYQLMIVKDYIEKNKDQMPPAEGMTASESAKLNQQIRESLKKEKVNKTFEDWLREALKSSRVKRLSTNEIK